MRTQRRTHGWLRHLISWGKVNIIKPGKKRSYLSTNDLGADRKPKEDYVADRKRRKKREQPKEFFWR